MLCLFLFHRCFCTTGIDIYQVDCKELVHQLNKVVKSVYTLPEEQQSQQGAPINPTAYRSMRDHIHPPRVSAPPCIIPLADDVVVRPYLMPLLPTFHGMENENPYMHIREFEEVCTTFKEGVPDMDLLKLKAFPLTLKDKAKIWLNSLRPRTIRNWAELQAEFLKKFFSTTKTNSLKRQSVGRGSWRPSVHVHTMVSIHGCL